jgi:hypothetical protein
LVDLIKLFQQRDKVGVFQTVALRWTVQGEGGNTCSDV